MAGDWQSYPVNTAPAANDTLLEDDVSDTTASAAGTVKQVTISAAVQAGLGLTTQGDLAVAGASGVPQRLAAGASGYVLTAHGPGALPTWAAASGGGGGAVAYISPSGDTTGATDKTAINTALTSSGIANLVPGGHYYINGPIVIPGSLCRIDGGWPYGAAQDDSYGYSGGQPGGTLITCVGGFTGNAAILMGNSTPGVQYYGVYLNGFTIDMTETVSSTGTATVGGNSGLTTPMGICVTGAWGACFATGVFIHKSMGDCWYFSADNTTTYVPDDWFIGWCKASGSENQNGFNLQHLPDSWILTCESSEHNTDDWVFGYCSNTRLISCKAENSGGAGYHCTGLGVSSGTPMSMEFIGCTSDLNDLDAWLFDNSGGGGAVGSTYVLTGCRSTGDGQAGGTTYAGFRSAGNLSRVVATGCVSQPNTIGPAYGAAETGHSYGMCFTGSYLSGKTAATYDDTSNTHALLNQSPCPF